jgi:hypothetical protein
MDKNGTKTYYKVLVRKIIDFTPSIALNPSHKGLAFVAW